MLSAFAVHGDLTWVPDSPPTGKTFKMSKNECESTLFTVDVNEIYATLTSFDSGTCGSSTAPCHGIGAGDKENAVSMRVRRSFAFFDVCENDAQNRMNTAFFNFPTSV